MNEDSPIQHASTVTAAEAVRRFSTVRQRASQGPVVITQHGRESHILCSAALFRSLVKRSEQPIAYGAALETAQLAAWIDEGLLLVDPDWRIVHANTALMFVLPCDPASLIGRSVFDALPDLCGTAAEAFVRRGMTVRDVRMIDLASPFRVGRWLQCRHAPVGRHLAILIRDVADRNDDDVGRIS